MWPQQSFGSDVSCEKQQAVIPKLTKYRLCRRWWSEWYRPTCHRERKAVRRADSGIIEIYVDGITIRAWRGADTAMISSIVQALKASR
ncbi:MULTISPECIES: hypothetical protein [unclassified Bradyrhizobium]|uniref:hypothetical protein n=1 Tax=unclassified Bradyrhizobium TaxID=2631580 RepID=UPI001FFC217F|nr:MULTISPECIES: hypothetical protein [unclassified Bradyrhizobium]